MEINNNKSREEKEAENIEKEQEGDILSDLMQLISKHRHTN